jgi:hypothetical protein
MLPGAADFQVAHRDLKSGAEVRIFLDRFQTLRCNRCDGAIGRQEQVTVRAVLVTSDATAKLVQLAETKPIGVVDQDRVDVRYIQARFDDRRADEDVRFVADELQHHVFELALAHLPVTDQDPRVRDHLLDLLGHLEDVVHPVVHEVHLSLALKLAHDRELHAVAVVRHHFGHDAAAVLRRGRQRADIAKSEHAHVQRARDRRGRHRQHVHRSSHLL